MNKNFIQAGSDFCSLNQHVAAPYLRRSFALDFVPESADISICGLGFYLLCFCIFFQVYILISL